MKLLEGLDSHDHVVLMDNILTSVKLLVDIAAKGTLVLVQFDWIASAYCLFWPILSCGVKKCRGLLGGECTPITKLLVSYGVTKNLCFFYPLTHHHSYLLVAHLLLCHQDFLQWWWMYLHHLFSKSIQHGWGVSTWLIKFIHLIHVECDPINRYFF